MFRLTLTEGITGDRVFPYSLYECSAAKAKKLGRSDVLVWEGIRSRPFET